MQATGSDPILHPSVLGRAVLSLVLLAGFYAFVLALCAALFAIPAVLLHAGLRDLRSILFLFAVCWIPGLLL